MQTRSLLSNNLSFLPCPGAVVIRRAHISFIIMKHDEARKRICICCFNKINSSHFDLNNLPHTVHDQLSRQVIADYNMNDPRLPSGLCRSCRSKLKRVDEGERGNSFDLEQINSFISNLVRVSPRTDTCACLICELASANGFTAKKILSKINHGRPSIGPKPVIHNVCGLCLTPIYRGCNHFCCETTLLENLLNNIPSKVQEKLASAVVKRKSEEVRAKAITLKTGGKPLPVTVGPPEKKRRQVTHEDISKIQSDAGLSLEQSFTVAANFRIATADRNLIQPHLKPATIVRNKKLDHLFAKVDFNGEPLVSNSL